MGFNTYKENLIRGIENNFRLARTSCSSGSIHDFRVGIKRLRSMIKIFADVNGGVKAGEYEKKLRPLFKAAGVVRDLHVTEELIWRWAVENSADISEYYNYLKDKESKAKIKCRKVCGGNNTKVLAGLSYAMSLNLKDFAADYLERHVGRSVVAGLLRIAARRNSPPLPMTELHSLRIETKDARYRLQTLSAILDDNNLLKKADSWLRSVHQSIGQWHDMIVAQEKLDSFLKREAVKPLYSPASYEKLKKELKNRADDAYQKLLNFWQDPAGVLGGTIELLQKYNI